MAHLANITLLSSQVSGSANHSNFSVLIDLSDPDVPAAFWSTVQNGGADIRIFASDGTTELAREVVSCDTTAETGEVWVKIPSLSYNTDTVIQLHADGTSSEPAVGSTYGRNAVWTSERLVHHLRETSGSVATDSTGSTNGAYAGSLPNPSGIGQDFAGSSDYVTLESMVNIAEMESAFTLRAKINLDNSSGIDHIISSDGANRNLQFRINNSKIGFIRWDFGGSIVDNYEGSTALSTGVDYWVAATFDGSVGTRIYLNGVQDGSTSTTGTQRIANNPMYIGARNGSSTSENMDGRVGEARVSIDAKSSHWLLTEYNNQSSPSTFYTIAAVSAGGTSPKGPMGHVFRGPFGGPM